MLDMTEIVPLASFDRKYEGLTRFPAVTRDLSMIVPKDIRVGQLEDIILQRGGKILENAELFDLYEGEQIREGCKSVAYSLTFRAKDRTLEESDISGAMKKS